MTGTCACRGLERPERDIALIVVKRARSQRHEPPARQAEGGADVSTKQAPERTFEPPPDPVAITAVTGWVSADEYHGQRVTRIAEYHRGDCPLVACGADVIATVPLSQVQFAGALLEHGNKAELLAGRPDGTGAGTRESTSP